MVLISISLIFAVGYWHLHPLVLLMLLITWIPDVVLIGILGERWNE